MLQAELAPRGGTRKGIGLAADVLELERRGAEQRIPVQSAEKRVELRRVHAGGEGAADQAAHARAGGDVDRDAVFLEPLDDADVCDAARAAAAERDPDARALGLLRAG